MVDQMRITKTDKDMIINEIIEIEWDMFDRVQNQGGRAPCQNDQWTFYVMRYSQHNAFSRDMLESYKKDLRQAQASGRNLLTEKYAYMMEYTDPTYFQVNLKPHLPPISQEKEALISQISSLMIAQQQRFAVQYPAFSSKGRPMSESEGNVSVHVYQTGELKTYSVETLRLYLRDIQLAELDHRDIVFDIHRKTAEFYGYASLMEAEDKLR